MIPSRNRGWLYSRSPPWHRWGSGRGRDLTRCVGPFAWHRAWDEDRFSGVRRRWWRGVPQPPRQNGQDEAAAVAEAESLHGSPHALRARRVAEELPVDRHWCTVWGESPVTFRGCVCVTDWNRCCLCPEAWLHLLTDVHLLGFYNASPLYTPRFVQTFSQGKVENISVTLWSDIIGCDMTSRENLVKQLIYTISGNSEKKKCQCWYRQTISNPTDIVAVDFFSVEGLISEL